MPELDTATVYQTDFRGQDAANDRETAARLLVKGALGSEPPTETQKNAVASITNNYISLVYCILADLPPSAERTLVLRGIEASKMLAVNAVFRTVK